jgi:hypothetical protein
MTSLLQFPNMESIPFKNLFSDFFYRLSFSFNRAETSSFAHPVHIFWKKIFSSYLSISCSAEEGNKIGAFG